MALYPHRFCYASVGWTRGLTLPRAFSTAECTGWPEGSGRRGDQAEPTAVVQACGWLPRMPPKARHGAVAPARLGAAVPLRSHRVRVPARTSRDAAGRPLDLPGWIGLQLLISRDGSESPPPGFGRIEAPRRWPSWFRRARQAASTNAEPGRGGKRLRDALVLRRRRCVPGPTPATSVGRRVRPGPAVQHL